MDLVLPHISIIHIKIDLVKLDKPLDRRITHIH